MVIELRNRLSVRMTEEESQFFAVVKTENGLGTDSDVFHYIFNTRIRPNKNVPKAQSDHSECQRIIDKLKKDLEHAKTMWDANFREYVRIENEHERCKQNPWWWTYR